MSFNAKLFMTPRIGRESEKIKNHPEKFKNVAITRVHLYTSQLLLINRKSKTGDVPFEKKQI